MNLNLLIYLINIFSLTTCTCIAKTVPSDEDVTESEKTCTSSSTLRPSQPKMIRDGNIQPIDPRSFEPVKLENDNETLSNISISKIPEGKSIDLQYVKDFLPNEISQRLIQFCDERGGWTTSPQTVNGQSIVRKASRTSRSCPLIWSQMYLPYLYSNSQQYQEKLASLKDEIELSWNITQRIASLLNINEEYIEPFQLIRYLPGEFYKEHHDHGSYYGANTEQRPWTFLVFLSDIFNSECNENDVGGYTKFNALDIAIVPRRGDGVLWRNVDKDSGEILLDAVHEAIPPAISNDVIKYAMNVWVAKDKIMDNMDVSAYRTY